MCPQNEKKSLLESIGSGVSSLRELSWETAGIEQQFRSTFNNFGSRVTKIVGPASNPIKEYAQERPFSAFLIGLFIAICAFPVLIFLSFALVTVSIGVISFLFIEGTILSVALLILGSCLLTLSLIGISVGAGILIIYLIITKTKQFTNSALNSLRPSGNNSSTNNVEKEKNYENSNPQNSAQNGGKVEEEQDHELSSTESDETEVVSNTQ